MLIGVVRYWMNLLLAVAMRLPSPYVRELVLRRWLGCVVGEGTFIGRGLTVLARKPFTVGRQTHISGTATVDPRGGLVIGDHVDIAGGVQILTADHDPDATGFDYRERGVTIGDRVWLATASIVLPGTRLANGTVIGAGAVVRGTTEPDSIYAGNPAVFVRKRASGAQAEHPTSRRRRRSRP